MHRESAAVPCIFLAVYEFRRQRPLPSSAWALTQTETPETGQKITRDHYVTYSLGTLCTVHRPEVIDHADAIL